MTETDEMLKNAVELRAGCPLQVVSVPRPFLRTVGIRLEDCPPVGYAARSWNGSAWGPQTLVGFFAEGMLPGGAGAPCLSACAARYYAATPLAHDVWCSLELQSLLRSARFRGLLFALVDPNGDVVDVTSLPPAGALCGVLEGVRGSLADWLAAPSALLESWTASLVVSRFPWPEENNGAVPVGPLEPRAARHFWSAVGPLEDHQVVSCSTLLGWATAWSQRLGDAVGRAARTAQALAVDGLQWRVGAHKDLLARFASFVNAGLLAGPVDIPVLPDLRRA